MAEANSEITFTRPSETTVTETTPVAATPAPVEPIIDPATGEPTLAADAHAPVTEKVETKPDEPAIRKLALAAREARLAREEADKVKAELAETKAKLNAPVASADVQAELDAIKKDPTLLFKHGWDADKLMKKVLSPDDTTETDPVIADLKKRVEEGEARAAKAEEEKKKQEEANRAAEFERAVSEATANVAKYIETKKSEFFLCDSDDAASITRSVQAQLNKWIEEDKAKGKVYEPTADDAKDLVDQAIKQRHEKRQKRFGSRLVATPAATTEVESTSNSAVPLREIPFTDGVKAAKPRDLKTVDPKPKVKNTPTTGEPLPARVAPLEIGFTKN